MKENIHPHYGDVAFRDSNTGDIFIIGSTMQSDTQIEVEGKTYPLVVLDVSSYSHPFYTGKQKNTLNEGQIAKFNKRYNLDEQ
ncbi:type B 50S ribosomal protein L31 [Erysipelothrix aquatica]|uniref:type B 50S ribosomal protein L31 n=1 Tax=Erysipelothrix aquatica TaxID=2683714 RepID=UPI00135B6291|nr:type B 50S ribosomal protein L31 [Erysipelothrix aquatica]